MDSEARDTYLRTVEPRFVPIVEELDRLIRAAGSELATSISYRMLMYARAGDFRHWVCAIDARERKVNLRFLHGAELDAPKGALRPGSTTMGTLELESVGQIDRDLISRLVVEAAGRLDEFRAAEAKGRQADAT